MPPRIVDICPLLQVFDMVESLAFCCDALGFEVHQHASWLDAPYGVRQLTLKDPDG